MKSATSHATGTPSVIARNPQGRVTVTLGDGRCLELDPLRDACRQSAQALRERAISDFAGALAAACRRLLAGRPARRTRPAGVLAHRA